ncbi:MAG: DUF2089 domain-containing protein [Actinomycetota bacterium]
MSRFAPRTCPVCADQLALTRLGCHSCGTELSGDFTQCEYCILTEEERETLRVFLASRGNMKELERHLNVSYPTARARFDDLLGKLGIKAETPASPRSDVLERLARGEIDVDEALNRLS